VQYLEMIRWPFCVGAQMREVTLVQILNAFRCHQTFFIDFGRRLSLSPTSPLPRKIFVNDNQLPVQHAELQAKGVVHL
jgi:hypothetical protein